MRKYTEAELDSMKRLDLLNIVYEMAAEKSVLPSEIIPNNSPIDLIIDTILELQEDAGGSSRGF